MGNRSFLLIIFILVISCKETRKGASSKTGAETAHKPQKTAPSHLIRESQIGIFKIGDAIPDTIRKIKKTKRTRMTESGPVVETIYILSENNTKELVLVPKYDLKNKTTEVIGEIWALSEKYKTKEGIGVNSTLKEFQKAYPNYDMWYTYVSDRYVIENSVSSIQFLLRESDFIGKIKVNKVKVPLRAGQFKEDTKISKIRVYK